MMKSLFVQLRTETLRASEESELPDFLATRLLAIADNPGDYSAAGEEIQALIEMLPLYDTYGQTGYIGMGVSNLILEGAIRRAEAKRRPASTEAEFGGHLT